MIFSEYATQEDLWFSSRQVIEGTDTLEKIEKVSTYNERPTQDIRITDCGVITYDF